MSACIVGHGLDIEEVERVDILMKRHGDRFLNRIFLSEEIDHATSNHFPAMHFAARFAAKEAVSKALGTGIGKELGWRDMEICKNNRGEPFLRLHGKGKTLAEKRGVIRSFISLSHTRGLAVASCILIGK